MELVVEKIIIIIIKIIIIKKEILQILKITHKVIMEQNNDQLILYEALILRIGNEYNHNDMK